MRPTFAEVIIDRPVPELDRPFTYRIPEPFADRIEIGSAVRVPFGRGDRLIGGTVTGFPNEPSVEEDKLKEIREVLTGSETVESELVQLAFQMSRLYGSTMARALHTVFPARRRIGEKREETVSLAVSAEAAGTEIENLEKKHQAARARVLSCLLAGGPMERQELQRASGVPADVVRALEEKGLIAVESRALFRGTASDEESREAEELTADQRQALNGIFDEWNGQDRPCLLFGVTGSGKTLIYMELIERVIAEGKQAIVLIPEIALTYQTVRRFVRHFGKGVSFLHSRLTEGERYDQFRAAKEGRIRIMVGPRSALFTPFPDLGLILIDEEHEPTYHSENVPRYHARETAVLRASIAGAHVVMGSATPSVEAYSRCKNGEYALVKLHGRYGGRPLPETVCVDMREELKNGNRTAISGILRERLAACLGAGKQAMLFLNRRGFAGSVSCRSCGHVIRCPHCDVAMTEHRGGKMICHYCGYTRPLPKTCPECGSPFIGGMKIGTQQLEEAIGREFPDARVLRMDLDTTRGKEGHREILAAFGEHRADVLVGTQMIVKGHDFPDVTLVGIVMADLSLNESDFRASERTFSLITQAIGRCGRGETPGCAVIQTYQPENSAIRAAARQDYEAFFEEEIAYRKLMRYPPAGEMAAVLGIGEDEAVLTTAMQYLRKYLDRIANGRIAAIGPAPASVGKIRDRYRQVLYIRAESENALTAAKDRAEAYIAANEGFRGLSIQFDRGAR